VTLENSAVYLRRFKRCLQAEFVRGLQAPFTSAV